MVVTLKGNHVEELNKVTRVTSKFTIVAREINIPKTNFIVVVGEMSLNDNAHQAQASSLECFPELLRDEIKLRNPDCFIGDGAQYVTDDSLATAVQRLDIRKI